VSLHQLSLQDIFLIKHPYDKLVMHKMVNLHNILYYHFTHSHTCTGETVGGGPVHERHYSVVRTCWHQSFRFCVNRYVFAESADSRTQWPSTAVLYVIQTRRRNFCLKAHSTDVPMETSRRKFLESRLTAEECDEEGELEFKRMARLRRVGGSRIFKSSYPIYLGYQYLLFQYFPSRT